MTIKTLKKPNLILNKFGLILLLLIGSITTSCSHLFFEEIQPKGGELQNEFPSKIQGDYSNWCYTNSEGKDICYDRNEIMAIDTIQLKNLVNQDTNIRNAIFIQFEDKKINFESLSTDLNGKYELNKDVFLSKIDSFYVLNLKIDSKNYIRTNGKAVKKDLYECFAFLLDSSDNVQIFRITDDALLKHKTAIIPKEGGVESHISKNQITKKNIIKVLYYRPIPFILLYKAKGIVNGPQINEEAGVECEPTKREYNKFLRTEKRALKKSN
jgi:hypothetical protein